MRIILDTGIFYRPDAWHELAGRTVVVPAVVYAERVRQLRRDSRTVEELDFILHQMDASVEPLTQLLAATLKGMDDRTWRRLSRDAMVACHVRDDDILWTTNPADFLELGLTPEQVVALP